ncbi:MAG: carbamoyl phosphate synthase small subunit, partial [Candidatus Omnitrophica bacterium]|nr:carbamoyl phosphate synthase small subunit [Candidatus Omnitrophota bacterium]
MKAKIVLEDGKVFEGRALGCFGECYGEMVFNTSMTGYQEIITDPSYKGQIVVMTYPLIGNYGINDEDSESANPHLEGFVVKELSKTFSNWRAKMGLDEYFSKNNILAVENIDTRALTRHIRLKGAMKAVISTDDLEDKSLLIKVKASKGLIGEDLVQYVSCKERYNWNENGLFKVAVLDCGTKYNILRLLEANNCQVSVFPACSKADQVLSYKPQ